MRRLLSKITLIAAPKRRRRSALYLAWPETQPAGGDRQPRNSISPSRLNLRPVLSLRRQWAPRRRVWIATSTHDGEEAIILQAHRKLLEKFPICC